MNIATQPFLIVNEVKKTTDAKEYIRVSSTLETLTLTLSMGKLLARLGRRGQVWT